MLRIDGLVKSTVNLSMAQLRNDFPQHEVIAALQVSFHTHTLSIASN